MESTATPGPIDPVTQFRELYEREYLAVFRSVRAIVLDPSAAEDLTQEAFVKAYRARHGYKPTAPVGAWLHRIAVNTAISYLRRQKLAKLLPVRLYTPAHSNEYDRADARSVVELALADLSPKLRAVVALHYYQGYTRVEIAAALGIPSGTVASRLAKAVATMRRRLGDQNPEPGRLVDEGAIR